MSAQSQGGRITNLPPKAPTHVYVCVRVFVYNSGSGSDAAPALRPVGRAGVRLSARGCNTCRPLLCPESSACSQAIAGIVDLDVVHAPSRSGAGQVPAPALWRVGGFEAALVTWMSVVVMVSTVCALCHRRSAFGTYPSSHSRHRRSPAHDGKAHLRRSV